VQHVADSMAYLRDTPEMPAALAGWSSVQPQAALAWLDGQEDGDTKENLVYGLLDGWAMTDFLAAARYAESRPRSTARNRFRQLLLHRSLRAGGLDGAQQWFYGISNDEHNQRYREMAFGEVVDVMLYRDPAAAAHWITQMQGQPFVSQETILRTASSMASTANPMDTLAWLQSLSGLDEATESRGMTSIVGTWATRDAEAASLWLDQQTDSPHYDAMAGQFARSIAASAPDTALACVNTIEDEAQRDVALAQVTRTLVQRHQDAAVAFLVGSGLDLSRAQVLYDQAMQSAQPQFSWSFAPSGQVDFDRQHITIMGEGQTLDVSGSLNHIVLDTLGVVEGDAQVQDVKVEHAYSPDGATIIKARTVTLDQR